MRARFAQSQDMAEDPPRRPVLLWREETQKTRLGLSGRALKHVDPFGQIQSGREILYLRVGKRDLLYRVCAGIILLNGDAILKHVNDHVFPQGGGAFVHQCHNRGVKFVLDTEHTASLADRGEGASISLWPLGDEVVNLLLYQSVEREPEGCHAP